MIIDTHHHLWQFNKEDYGWMDDSMDILRRDFLPEELEDQLQEAGVAGTVVVQARQKIEETRWLLKLADENEFIKGVVGWVDLRSENLEEELDLFTSNPKFVGVRHVIHDEPDDDFMLGSQFVTGIGKLEEYNLTYDLLLFPEHLKNAQKLVKMFPKQKFVLDHISKPLIKSGTIQPWKRGIEALSGEENVWCKISGMVTEADLENWKQEDFIPYLDVVVEMFGIDRIMLGSDWPVCRLAGSYDEIMNIPEEYFKSFSTDEKMNIFNNNAVEFYGLDKR